MGNIKLLNITTGDVGLVATIVGIVVGVFTIFSWWLSRYLKSNADTAIHEIRIDELERRMNNVEQEQREIRKNNH